jgi:hypothetical protein
MAVASKALLTGKRNLDGPYMKTILAIENAIVIKRPTIF